MYVGDCHDGGELTWNDPKIWFVYPIQFSIM